MIVVHFVRMRPLIGFLVLYVAMYSAFGVASPFWPMFFQSRGLSSQQLGTLLALGTLARLIIVPITTLSDALAISSATDPRRKHFEYGLVRGTGSAAFVVGTLFAGQLLGRN